MPRSGVAEEPFPSPCVSDLRVPACLLLARIDGRSPTSTDQWLLSSAVHYDRSWPTAAVPHSRHKSFGDARLLTRTAAYGLRGELTVSANCGRTTSPPKLPGSRHSRHIAGRDTLPAGNRSDDVRTRSRAWRNTPSEIDPAAIGGEFA